MAEEGLQETSNKLIHIGKPIVMDDEEFCHQLDRLEKACQEETEDMKDIVASVVPTYRRKKSFCNDKSLSRTTVRTRAAPTEFSAGAALSLSGDGSVRLL